jgi:hypothetical protein
MYNCIAGEIRYLAITATRLLEDPQFKSTFEMLLEKRVTEGRTLTLRFYIMDPDSLAISKFAELSDESVESLKSRINRSYEILKSLVSNEMKNKVLIRVYFYSEIPVINLMQIDNEYFFRPYKTGRKQGYFDVFHITEHEESDDLALMLRNIIVNLGFRSHYEDINWL